MSERVVIVDSPEIAARGAELFPNATVLYANGALPPEALTYADALIFSKDLDRLNTFGLAFAAAQCKLIRVANADLSTLDRAAILAMNQAGQIKPFKAPAIAAIGTATAVQTPAGAEPDVNALLAEVASEDRSERAQSDPIPGWHEDIPEAPETIQRTIRNDSALKRAAHEREPGEWGDPCDFWSITPLPEFRAEYLPAEIAPYVMDQSDRAGVDPAQVAVNCYVICAALIRTGIELQMQPDSGDEGRTWREKPILWGASVGDPSTGKGPALDIALHKPQKMEHAMRLQDAAAWERYEEEAKIHEKRMQSYIAEAAKPNSTAIRPEAPEKPPRNRLFIDDATKEVVAKILTENPRGKITVLKDELAGWFGSFGAYGAAGAEKDRGDWLSFYESKQKWIDRATEGRSYHVESWGGCILGGIQPEKLAEIAKRLGADGMLQRFMIVSSKPKRRMPARPADSDAVSKWNRILENLAGMSSPGGSVQLSPEAASFMDEQAQWITSAMQSGIPPALVAALGKWEGLFGRLMITSHCIACAAVGMPFPAAQVSLETAQQCWRWMRYVLWPHAVHFYTGLADQGDEARSVRAFADYVLARDIRKVKPHWITSNWSHYRRNFPTAAKRREFWIMAEQAGWVRPVGVFDRNGQISSEYEVNPLAFDGRFDAQIREAQAAANRYREAMHPQMLAQQQSREPGEEG